MQRPYPAQLPAPPSHRFRPGEVAHDPRQDLGHDLRRCPSRSLDRRYVEIALLVGADLGLIERLEASRFEESLYRCIWGADARALLLLAHIGRARRQAIDHDRQPPRRGEALHGIEAEACALQPVTEQAGEIFRRAHLHARRNLFREQLEQKLSHERPRADQAWAPPASVLSHAAQTARASSRTRRMKACRSVTEITPRASSRLKMCEALIVWS